MGIPFLSITLLQQLNNVSNSNETHFVLNLFKFRFSWDYKYEVIRWGRADKSRVRSVSEENTITS